MEERYVESYLQDFYDRFGWSYSAADLYRDYPDEVKRHHVTLPEGEISIYEIVDPVLYGTPALILSKNRKLLGDTVIYQTYKLILPSTAKNVFPARRLEGEYLVLDSPWAKYFWHWIMEYVPRVLIAERCGFRGFYIVSTKAPSFQIDTLARIGISKDRLVARGGSPIWVERLWYPEVLVGTPGHSLKDTSSYTSLLSDIREKILGPLINNVPVNRRVYISRRKSDRGRHVVNEAELVALLGSYGIEESVMEDLSLHEQLEIMSNASLLVGPHGAGMVHVLFMPPRSTVVELFSPHYVPAANAAAMKLLQHHYFPIIPPKENYKYGEEIYADLEKVKEVLEKVLA